MKWKFGVRRLENGKLIITEEFGKKYGYAVVGVLDNYSTRELRLLAHDLSNVRIQKDDGTGIYDYYRYIAAHPIEGSCPPA